MITFTMPAKDDQLAFEVYNYLYKHKDVSIGKVLVSLPRKFKFAGYIGSIMHLSDENEQLRSSLMWLSLVTFLNLTFTTFVFCVK
jgi:hypothetical protein